MKTKKLSRITLYTLFFIINSMSMDILFSLIEDKPVIGRFSILLFSSSIVVLGLIWLARKESDKETIELNGQLFDEHQLMMLTKSSVITLLAVTVMSVFVYYSNQGQLMIRNNNVFSIVFLVGWIVYIGSLGYFRFKK